MATNIDYDKNALSGLARRLVDRQLLDAHAASEIRRAASQSGQSFIAHLIKSDKLDARSLAESVAAEFHLPMVDLRTVEPEPAALEAISPELVRKHLVLPISRSNRRLRVAVSDPTRLQAFRELQFQSGLTVEPVIAEHNILLRTINRQFSELDSIAAELDDGPEVVTEQPVEDLVDSADESGADDAPIVRFVNKVLLDAINRGASDIHFEPYEKEFRIRFRLDGVLHERTAPPKQQAPRLLARLKVMSRLDLAERRVPQDGRMKLSIGRNQVVDFRVSTCPTLYGEKIVLRLLDPTSAQIGIDKLGYEEDQRRIFEQTILRPQGMVLVTGPTGSGKTVSMYTALNILNNEERNISTAEDPAEISLPGINQVNVHPQIGLDFAACLRSFLRQGPDVIMVGEIRDLETAEIAIKAAQTGHMVLSTVHTNNAPETLTRLLNMGVPAYNITSSVSLIIAQRLARRLCTHCKVRAEASREELVEAGFDEQEIDHLELYEANDKGCDYCTKGYKGRIGLYQVMPVSNEIGRIIITGGNARDIDEQAHKEGVIDLYQAGLNKARAGTVSLTEVNRVTVS